MIGDLEIVLPRRVVPQPHPAIHKGGDCAACVLAGLVDISVEQVYTDVYRQSLDEPKAPCWPEMLTALGRLYWDNKLDRFVDTIPFWPSGNALRVFGDSAVLQAASWFKYVTMALDAGYYGLMHYRMDGDPTQLPDHYVMIVGARVWHDPIEGKRAWNVRQELLVSCSSTRTPPEFWLGLDELFTKRGGFNVLLARPMED